jgi:hypothetical protein
VIKSKILQRRSGFSWDNFVQLGTQTTSKLAASSPPERVRSGIFIELNTRFRFIRLGDNRPMPARLNFDGIVLMSDRADPRA